MKTLLLKLLLSVLLFPIAACSTQKEKREPPDGYFATHIDEDGTRMFQYSLEMPESRSGGGRPGNTRGHVSGGSSRGVSGGVTAGSRGGRSGKSYSGASGGAGRFEKINSLLENRLEMELVKSDFCEAGHKETERVVDPPDVFIRGECKDVASDQDLEDNLNTHSVAAHQ